MRRLVALLSVAVAAAAVTFVASPASACGDAVDVPQVTRRPPVSPTSALIAEAARLESRAAATEAQAAEVEREAQTFVAQAMQLRQQARVREDLERARLLTRASRLEAQAASSRAQAASEVEAAAELRSRAKGLRQQALRVGGGWRRALPPVSATQF